MYGSMWEPVFVSVFLILCENNQCLCLRLCFSNIWRETYFGQEELETEILTYSTCDWKPNSILSELTRLYSITFSISTQPSPHKHTPMKLIQRLTFKPDQHSQISSLALFFSTDSHTHTHNINTCVYLTSEHGGVNRHYRSVTSCSQSHDQTSPVKQSSPPAQTLPSSIYSWTNRQMHGWK